MTPALSITLTERLKLPVETVEVDGLPKILAGNVPVTPLNVILKWKLENRGATRSSLDSYARAGKLYVEFAAHRGRSLVDVTNEEFRWLTQALQGRHFLDENGVQRLLGGARGPRTGDTMIALLYSLAADLQEIYQIRFDWHRYRGVSNELVELVRARGGKMRSNAFRRAHRIPYTPRKILPLPDEEFERLLLAARSMWGSTVADGDKAFADDPDAQCGALFYRNLGILLTLRFEGARRSEPTYITLDDVDRQNSRIYLVTKGHGGARGEKLPVLLHPWVEGAIWMYVTKYRPVTAENSVKGYPVFVSHSTRNYGERISAQTVRKVIDALRDSLTPPWDKLVSPHALRHSFARDLQVRGGEAAAMINMRHASVESLTPYSASPEVFADELLESGETRLTRLLSQFGIELVNEGRYA